MKLRRTLALALLGATVVTATVVPAASATETTIASVLNDGSGFDTNWYDFDILDTAVGAVLGAKPNSPLQAVTSSATAFTVFAPNDRAFQVLVASLTGKWYWTEAGVTNALIAALGGGATAINTIETVVLYHVLPTKYTYSQLKTFGINGESKATALGPTIKFRYYSWINTLSLKDKDPNAANPWVTSVRNVPAGNSLIQGISLVLRPADLPPLAAN